MKINFFEEFPEKDLEKGRMIDFACVIYIAARLFRRSFMF